MNSDPVSAAGYSDKILGFLYSIKFSIPSTIEGHGVHRIAQKAEKIGKEDVTSE